MPAPEMSVQYRVVVAMHLGIPDGEEVESELIPFTQDENVVYRTIYNIIRNTLGEQGVDNIPEEFDPDFDFISTALTGVLLVPILVCNGMEFTLSPFVTPKFEDVASYSAEKFSIFPFNPKGILYGY